MADYTVINATSADIVVNAGSVVAPKKGQVSGATLTNTELAAVLANDGVAVMKTGQTPTDRHRLHKLIRFGIYPTDRS